MIKTKAKLLRIRDPETKEFIPLVAIQGEQGTPGGIDCAVNEFGDSEHLVITQKALTERFNSVDSNIVTLQGDCDALKEAVTDIPTIKEDVTELQAETVDIPEMRTDIGNLKTATAEIPEMKTDLNNAKTEVQLVKQQLSNLGSGSASSEELSALKDRVSTAEQEIEELSALKDRVSTAEQEIEALATRVFTAEQEIESIQNELRSDPSAGLVFRVMDNKYAVLTGVSESFAGSHVVIPESYNGYPVTVIEGYFEGESDSRIASITSIVVPHTVHSVNSGALSHMPNLSVCNFMSHKAVPYVGIGALCYNAQNFKVLVPSSLYESWSNNDEWAAIKDKITSV